jgi:lysine 2,3-aminomutase
MLKKYHPIYLNTHFNHPREITVQAREACERLVNAGIPVGCQTVLLKGVNDDPEVLKELMHKLLLMRVRPYYLYQADLTRGTNHFRTRVEVGLEIIRALRGHTTGFAVPQFAIDAPGGGGKIPLLPEYLVNLGDNRVIIVKRYYSHLNPNGVAKRRSRRVARRLPASPAGGVTLGGVRLSHLLGPPSCDRQTILDCCPWRR